MFCPNCGKEQTSGSDAKFCASCGKSLFIEPKPKGQLAPKLKQVAKKPINAAVPAIVSFGKAIITKIRSSNLRKIGLISGASLVGIALAVTGSILGVNAYQLTSTDEVHLSTVFDDQEIQKLIDVSCNSANGLLISYSEIETYNHQLALLTNEAAQSDARAVLRFQNNHVWTLDTMTDISAALRSQVKATLNEKLKDNQRIVKSSYASILTKLTTEFQDKVLTACSIRDQYDAQVSLAYRYNSAQMTFSAKADSAPWYPNGYFLGAGGQIAWKWIQKYDDCYSCRYSHVSVIAKDGCPGGVYAETNFEHNGVVIDWTNDSLPTLAAGQKAILEFVSYNSDADQTQAPTFTCHDY